MEQVAPGLCPAQIVYLEDKPGGRIWKRWRERSEQGAGRPVPMQRMAMGMWTDERTPADLMPR